MYILRKYGIQFERFVCAATSKAFLSAFAVLVFILATLAGVICKYGAPAMNGRPWDVTGVVGTAWRIFVGQVPHRDFYNYLGDLPYYMTYFGMKLGHPCFSAIDYGNVILMAVVAPLAFMFLHRRTSALFALFYSLFIGLLVVTQRPMGDSYDYTDHAMLYNRYGEAFAALFGILVFLTPKSEARSHWPDWAEAVLAGFLMVALLGSKINYFAIGIGFFAVAIIAGRIGFKWALVCVVSAAAATAIAFAATKIPISTMINDYRTLSGSESPGSRIRGVIVQGVKGIWWLPVLLLPIWEGFLGEMKPANQRAAASRHIFVVVAVFGAAILLLSTNCQISERPLLALAALYGAEVMQRQSPPSGENPYFVVTRRLGALLLVALFMLPPILADFRTIRYVTAKAVKKDWEVPVGWESTPLNDFRLITDGTRNAEMKGFKEDLSDTLAMLRRHKDPQMRLNSLLFGDPFQAALGIVPAIGGTVSLSLDGISKKSHQPLSQLIGNATHLLVDSNYAPLSQVYGTDWDALHLEKVDGTKSVILFKVPASRGGTLDKSTMLERSR